jgi:HPt (histidine-containing phosphotransfer) domain-containing protein
VTGPGSSSPRAHYIKGGAASLGVRAIVEAAERLERRAVAGDVLGLHEPLQCLLAEFHAGLACLRRDSQATSAAD